MEWTKVSIQTTSTGTELLTGLLSSLGVSDVEIFDPREYSVFLDQDKKAWDYADETLLRLPEGDVAEVIFYLPTDSGGLLTLEKIKCKLVDFKGLPIELGALELITELVDDDNWLHEWKKHFTPIYAGRVAIVPEWEAGVKLSPPPEIVFLIDPGSAFGTGQHATTFLCVEALDKWVKPGNAVLDVGCGSGILAVISLLLGAGSVFACDIDPSAITATYKNAALNKVDMASMRIEQGDVLSDGKFRKTIKAQVYDLVIANIVADVVIPLSDIVAEMLAENGLFIASGIIDDRVAEVLAAMKKSSFEILDNRLMEGWHCIVGRKVGGV